MKENLRKNCPRKSGKFQMSSLEENANKLLNPGCWIKQCLTYPAMPGWAILTLTLITTSQTFQIVLRSYNVWKKWDFEVESVKEPYHDNTTVRILFCVCVCGCVWVGLLRYKRLPPACALAHSVILLYNPIPLKSPSSIGTAISFSSLIMSSVMPGFNSFLCGRCGLKCSVLWYK